MLLEVQKLIPEKSRLLGMLHNADFRPSIAPHSVPAKKERVLFEQGGPTIEFATALRTPICLLSEADTELLRNIGDSKEGFNILECITDNSPTAAVLFDATRKINNNPVVHWFAEDSFFAETVARSIGVDPENILPLFQIQADETLNLLKNIWGSKGIKGKVVRHSFSEKEVIQAIKEAIRIEASKLTLKSSDRKKLGESSAAIVGATHALFPLIISLLSHRDELAAVQGPIHLETTPPNWLNNPALSTVRKFVDSTAADWNLNHRSLLPCLFKGEPIGEFSVFDPRDESPQLGRTQKHKLELWLNQSPFPLTENPIFGHAIGLIEDKRIAEIVANLIAAEENNNMELGIQMNKQLAKQIYFFLNDIKFWK